MATISVIVPTYNRSDVISRAVDSVLSQTYGDYEIIIIDDGSDDDTAAVVNSYSDSRICYIHQENQGANAARNKGIQMAQGRFISFLDSDDEYLPTRFQRCLDVISESSAMGVYHSYLGFTDGRESYVRRAKSGLTTLEDARQSNPIGSFSATMFDKRVFDKVGLLDEEMPSKQDYEFYLRVLKNYNLYGISDVLLHHHRRDDSIGRDFQRSLQGYTELLNRHGDLIDNEYRAQFWYNRGLQYASAGDICSSRGCFTNSIKLNPVRPVSYIRFFMTLFGVRIYNILNSLGKMFYLYRLDTNSN